MTTKSTPSRAAPVPISGGWPAYLNGRSITVALTLGGLAALLLNPVFITPLPILLGRTVAVAVLLLLLYAVAGRLSDLWHPGWMPHGALQVLTIMVGAPLVTLAVSLVAVDFDLTTFLNTKTRVLGAILIGGTSLMVGLVISVLAVLRERDAQARSQSLQFALERATLERQALDAQLSLLQAQIEPHFLFNTLANVQALVEEGSPRAPAVLKSLIAYLRAAMPRLHDKGATLGNELSLVRSYLELMQMRMPDRLRFGIDADPALAQRPFPAMALLTLVENAVRHGIDPSEDGGHIEVGARLRDDGAVQLWVSDTGVGMAPQAQPGTGLTNLRARLRAFFGDAADMQLSEASEAPPHGLRVDLILPADAAAS